jgi:dTDP-4-dehydrorhamnose 3,5-epimerase-like enzyme
MGLVQAVRLDVNIDDRGSLFEVLRSDDADYAGFGQVYVVTTRTVGTIRAFHRHSEMWDHFTIVAGAAKFAFVDGRPGDVPESAAPVYCVVGSAEVPTRIVVPPGVWHGHMTLVANSTLISVASLPYKGMGRSGIVDEQRVDPFFFVAAEDAWRVVYK